MLRSVALPPAAPCRPILSSPLLRCSARKSIRKPVQANLLLAPLGLVTNPFVLVAWAGGAYKFYSGFEKTNFSTDQATKARLVALWPVLYATNADFRKNFQKAIQS